MKFTGLCSYPHGGYTVLGLLLSGAAAMTTTLYAAASCRFLVVTFVSETGNFETFFTNIQEAAAGRPTATHKVGIGLFQFLRPFRQDSHWSDGSCAGYQETMLQEMSDTPFETARFFAVIAIVLSFLLLIWELLMIFVEFNRLQITIFCFIAMMGTLCCGMTFMVMKSAICNSVFLENKCEVDEGGLVMVAGSLLWFATMVLSAAFLRPSEASSSPLSRSEKAKIAAELEPQTTRQKKSWLSNTLETRNGYSVESVGSNDDDDDDESGRRRRRELQATIPNSVSMDSSSIASSHSGDDQSRFSRFRSFHRKRDASGKQGTVKHNLIIDDQSHPDSMEVFISESPRYR
ncbi:hypothetical protein FisN_7Lh208 [Fistulifera solaris]|uniref:Uncharacterized protein n=1 Tax=Fistulifera solaris TaxID=1519565 RepID=A0A1Z5JRU7_FISSO|nr:hypothetical protein FisN_7Lh208 [Fistulifera solaris]|eukprot:GAX16491.1 hypothetical protein FisN_7Lh208 [Fistulifera solaris]